MTYVSRLKYDAAVIQTLITLRKQHHLGMMVRNGVSAGVSSKETETDQSKVGTHRLGARPHRSKKESNFYRKSNNNLFKKKRNKNVALSVMKRNTGN